MARKCNKLCLGEKGNLSELNCGQRAKVMYLNCENRALKRRLLDMGITTNVEVLIKKVAPLGDPVDIELRGYELCLRRSDMKNIGIEVVS